VSTFRPYGGFPGGATIARGDLDGDGQPEIVTGAGPGGGPHVRGFDADGSALPTSFFAYAAGFSGGVSVALGDVDGDGDDEIITGAGPGGGPHVRVFTPTGTPRGGGFFAYSSGFTGGVSVAAGDVDGDGHDEIITGAGAGGGPHVKVFRADGSVLASFFAYDAGFHGGVSVAAGDADGDGRADVITGAGPGGGPHVKVFRINASTPASTPTTIGSFFAYDPGFIRGVRVGAGDGDAAVVTGTGPGGAPLVRLLRLDGSDVISAYAFNPMTTTGVNVAGGDGVAAAAASGDNAVRLF
jgi:hypothetical protein